MAISAQKLANWVRFFPMRRGLPLMHHAALILIEEKQDAHFLAEPSISATVDAAHPIDYLPRHHYQFHSSNRFENQQNII
ncbi:hypothetical protein ACQUKR_21540 [Ralstonia pseudosolanacearum]